MNETDFPRAPLLARSPRARAARAARRRLGRLAADLKALALIVARAVRDAREDAVGQRRRAHDGLRVRAGGLHEDDVRRDGGAARGLEHDEAARARDDAEGGLEEGRVLLMKRSERGQKS